MSQDQRDERSEQPEASLRQPASRRRPAGRIRGYFNRPTIRALKLQMDEEGTGHLWDQRYNEETKLPPGEEVHLGGLVLFEAFTPATVASLYQTLRESPSDRKKSWIDALTRSREGRNTGWVNMGVIRQPKQPVWGNGSHDPDLPDGVEGVWLHLNFITPSLTIVAATFSLAEEKVDLSPFLRQDYETRADNPRVEIRGRAARVREKIPWSRPRNYQAFHGLRDPLHRKSDACRELVKKQEELCSRWFYSRYAGRFSETQPENRPLGRLFLTRDRPPFQDRELKWFQPAGLAEPYDTWRSTTEENGWTLRFQGSWNQDGREVITAAARRSDAAKGDTNRTDTETNWHLTYRFALIHDHIMSLYASAALLVLYRTILGKLRDRPNSRLRMRRPVSEARTLDRFLVGDGLDAATITEDLKKLTSDTKRFQRNIPGFVEETSFYPKESSHSRDPDKLADRLQEAIRDSAERLMQDSTKTTENIRASAELRQAVANTRLQRMVLLLTVVATTIALISLVAN